MSNESINWTQKEIAIRQRELVDAQLAAMHSGQAPAHFGVVGMLATWLRGQTPEGHLTLLDAGCASAYYSEVLEFYETGFFRYTGLDFSPHMLEVARAHYPTIPLIEEDLRTLGGIDDRSYHVVLSGAALMHIREWEDVLRSLVRIADRWLLLHRTWLLTEPGPTQIEVGEAYGHCVWYITFEHHRLLEVVNQCGFGLVHSLHSGEEAGQGKVVRSLLFRRMGADG